MSFLPGVVLEKVQSDVEKQVISTYKDFLLDKNTMKFTTIGEGSEAIRNWVEYALKIPRYEYPVFPFDYGNECQSLIGESLDKNELEELVEYYIIDCLKVNQYIADVEVQNIVIQNEKITCDIYVTDIFGERIELNEYNI